MTREDITIPFSQDPQAKILAAAGCSCARIAEVYGYTDRRIQNFVDSALTNMWTHHRELCAELVIALHDGTLSDGLIDFAKALRAHFRKKDFGQEFAA